MTRFILILYLALLLPLLAACQSEAEQAVVSTIGDTATLSVRKPAFLDGARAVVDENLRLDVTVQNDPPSGAAGGTRSVSMTRTDANQWQGSISVPSGQYQVQVAWFESFADQDIPLAVSRDLVSMVGTQPASVSFDDRKFDTSNFDDDNDGWNNFRERVNNTDPLSAMDPGSNPPSTFLSLEIQAPEQLLDARLESERLLLSVAVNSGGVPMARDGNRWTGQVQVSLQQRTHVQLDWRYSGDTAALLGQLQDVFIAVDGSVYVPDASRYRWDYDLNSDGTSNLDELLNN